MDGAHVGPNPRVGGKRVFAEGVDLSGHPLPATLCRHVTFDYGVTKHVPHTFSSFCLELFLKTGLYYESCPFKHMYF